MLLAAIRRFFLFLAVVCGLGFALIFLHSLVEPIPFSRTFAAIGVGAAVIGILFNWIALAKSDDYLIPSHTVAFFAFAITVTSVIGFGLLAFFYFGKSYPDSFLQFYGIAPAILALIFGTIGFVRIKEAYSLPSEYRPNSESGFWVGFLPPAVSALAATAACALFVHTASEIHFVSRMVDNPAPSTSPADLGDQEKAAIAAQLLASARQLQTEQRYRGSHDNFLRAADLGNIDAHFELALIYSGDGYLRDEPKAIEHFTVAAENGHVESLYRLGRAFRHGELGLSPDFPKALENLEQAAQKGHVEAQKQLANMYNNGEGVAPDPAKAIQWFRAAAESGDASAQNDVAILLIQKGAESDPAEGVRWLKLAAEQGVTVAEYNLARSYYNGTLVEKDLARSFQYFTVLAEKGLPQAFQMTGIQLLHGQGVEKDETAAFRAFQAGAQRGDPLCRYYLGYCYLNGIGVTRDSSAALKHLEAAANRHIREAQSLLGKIYSEGTVLMADPIEAAKWFTLAAANGAEEAGELLEALDPALSAEDRQRATQLVTAFREKHPK